MSSILILVRSTKPFGTQRRDFDYIIEELIKEGNSVDIYDPKQKILYKVNSSEQKDYNVFPSFLFKSPIYLLLNFICFIRFTLMHKSKYDIVHINYVREEYLIVPNLVKRMGKKLHLQLFGTDINHRNFIKNNFTKLYTLASKVITTNPDFAKKANEIVGGDRVINKAHILMLPQDHFKFYDNFTFESKSENKQKLNWPLDKIIVAVGTSGSENEQIPGMINQLIKLNNIDQYYFVFNFSNRFNEMNNYEKELKAMVENNFEVNSYNINSEFLSFEDMSIRRSATDIYINMRKNDQLVATMLESNLSFCSVITGTWLPYNDYTSSVSTTLIDNLNEIAENVEKLSDKIKTDKEGLIKELSNNNIVVKQKYGPDVINDWVKLFN